MYLSEQQVSVACPPVAHSPLRWAVARGETSVVAGLAWLLFHAAFVMGVMVPFLRTIGAL